MVFSRFECARRPDVHLSSSFPSVPFTSRLLCSLVLSALSSVLCPLPSGPVPVVRGPVVFWSFGPWSSVRADGRTDGRTDGRLIRDCRREFCPTSFPSRLSVENCAVDPIHTSQNFPFFPTISHSWITISQFFPLIPTFSHNFPLIPVVRRFEPSHD